MFGFIFFSWASSCFIGGHIENSCGSRFEEYGDDGADGVQAVSFEIEQGSISNSECSKFLRRKFCKSHGRFRMLQECFSCFRLFRLHTKLPCLFRSLEKMGARRTPFPGVYRLRSPAPLFTSSPRAAESSASFKRSPCVLEIGTEIVSVKSLT